MGDGAQRYRLDDDDDLDLESPGMRRQNFGPPPGAESQAPQQALAQQAYQQPAAAAAAATTGLTDDEFSKQWLLGLGGERSLGRPKEWNGKEEGFDTFSFRFSNWLGAMPGNAEDLLEASSKRETPLLISEYGFRALVMSRL